MLGVEEGGEAWQWRRRLWDWEEDLVRECRLPLSDIILQVSIATDGIGTLKIMVAILSVVFTICLLQMTSKV